MAVESRVLRGGNWNNTSNNLQSSNRNNNGPTNENNNVGFRVAGSWLRGAHPLRADMPLLAARMAEGRCPPRPCRSQEPPGLPASGNAGSRWRIRSALAAVSSAWHESRGRSDGEKGGGHE